MINLSIFHFYHFVYPLNWHEDSDLGAFVNCKKTRGLYECSPT